MIPPFISATVPLEPADTSLYARFVEALRPAWPRQVDIKATFADGSTVVARALLDAPAGGTYAGALVSGPRMADGAWSPPVAMRHAAEIDGKPATVEIRRAER